MSVTRPVTSVVVQCALRTCNLFASSLFLTVGVRISTCFLSFLMLFLNLGLECCDYFYKRHFNDKEKSFFCFCCFFVFLIKIHKNEIVFFPSFF